MKKLLVTAILFFALGTNLIMAQDYNKGMEAYKAGDYATAIKEWKPLAEQGSAIAQFNLGYIYELGSGVLKDDTEAVKWYKLSAEQGNASAQFSLGDMYENGKGILQNNVIAHMWYNIASANGHKKAGEYRDERAGLMTAPEITKATAMAKECMNSNYKKCGW